MVEKKEKTEEDEAKSASRFKVKVEEDKVEAKKEDETPEVTSPAPESTEKPETASVPAEPSSEVEKVKEEVSPAPSSQSTVQYEELYPKKKGSLSLLTIFLAFIISLVIGGALVGGIFYYQNNVDNTGEVKEPGPTFTPPPETSSPLPTDENGVEDLDLTTYNVQVLNGSGKAGEAGKVETLLVSAGFVEIETGNAKSYDYTETEISIKEDVPAGVLDEALSALDVYSTSEGQALDKDNEFDIVVIIGSESS